MSSPPLSPGTTTPPGAIVVGLAGTTMDAACLAQATRVAALTGRPLHLVHARELVTGVDPMDVLLLASAAQGESWTDAEPLVRALASVAASHPRLQVTGAQPFSFPGHALIDASQNAYMVVVGAPPLNGWIRVLGHSALNVAAHAACQVVIVPAGSDPDPGGPVVVGVDGSTHSREALQRGFEVATTRGRPLIAVHAWHLEVEGQLVSTRGEHAWPEVERRGRAMLDGLIADLAPRHPQVAVTARTVHGQPAKVLAQLSEHAGVVVVASRGHGAVTGALLGSTTHRLAETAHCPVMVFRQRAA